MAALARTHSLLAQRHWSGADLEPVISEEPAPYLKGDSTRVSLSGPPVVIAPEAVQSLGMVFHELATNAAKYGALSVVLGKVEVLWEIQPNGDLRILWKETDGPPVLKPSKRGFGSTLIGGAVESQFGGSVNYQWHAEGLCCRRLHP